MTGRHRSIGRAWDALVYVALGAIVGLGSALAMRGQSQPRLVIVPIEVPAVSCEPLPMPSLRFAALRVNDGAP